MPDTDQIDSRIIEPLINAIIKDPHAEVRRAALRAVVRLPLPAEGWIAVGGMVYNLLRTGVFALLNGGEPPPVPLVDAIEAAAFIPVQQVREALQRILLLEDATVRRAAAHALAAAGDPSGTRVLIDALGDANPWDRYQTSKSIYRVRHNTGPFQEELRTRCREEEYGSARFWLALSLAALGEVEPLQGLFRDLQRGDCDMVELAKNPEESTFAGRIPQDALPLLRHIAADQNFDYGIRHIAEDLVGLAEPGQAAPARNEQPTTEATPEIESLLDDLVVRTKQFGADMLGMDHLLAQRLNETQGRFMVEPMKLFGYYRRLKHFHGPRMHVAWMASRAPLHAVTATLAARLDSDDAGERADAADLIELAARYRESHGAPYFGGGGDAPDTLTSFQPHLDFRAFGLTPGGTPPGYVGGVDPWPAAEEEAVRKAAPKAAPPPPEPAKPAAPADEVRLGAASLSTVKPGDRFVAAFAAYVPELENQVREEMRKRSRRSEPQLDMKTCRWRRGTSVQVVVTGEHLTADPPVDEFVWEGGRTVLAFEIAITAGAPLGNTVLKFNVFMAGIRVAMLPIEIEISASPGAPREGRVSVDPPHTAFASYASADRLRVMDRVTEIRNSAGIDIFEDCLDLRPGEEWKPALEREIQKRQMFFLFWSEHAKASPWVDWEWRTALHDKGIDAIALRPLQPMDQAPPPAELTKFHAEDPIMIIRDHYARRAGAKT